MKKKTHRILNSAKEDYNFFCDFGCKYAEFGAPEVNGACRKELAVWCTKFKKYNNKNNKCFMRHD